MIRIYICIFMFVMAILPTVALAQNDAAANPYNLSKQDLQTFESMTPTQQDAALADAQKEWQAMSPDKQQSAQAAVTAQFNSMSPAQQQALEQQALKKWQAMTPEEQQQLRTDFPALQQGNPTTN